MLNDFCQLSFACLMPTSTSYSDGSFHLSVHGPGHRSDAIGLCLHILQRTSGHAQISDRTHVHAAKHETVTCGHSQCSRRPCDLPNNFHGDPSKHLVAGVFPSCQHGTRLAFPRGRPNVGDASKSYHDVLLRPPISPLHS